MKFCTGPIAHYSRVTSIVALLRGGEDALTPPRVYTAGKTETLWKKEPM